MTRADNPDPPSAAVRWRRALTWSAGLLACHLLASFAFHSSVSFDHNLARTDRDFYAAPQNLQVLVTGDSHGRNAVAAKHLGERSVSIAIGGSTIIKIYHRLQNLLASDKTIEVVILSADDHVFLDHNRDQYHPIATWARHLNYTRLATEVHDARAMHLNALRANVFPYVDELPIWLSWLRGNRAHFRNEALDGRMDKETVYQRVTNSTERYQKVFGPGGGVDPLKRAYYDRTIDDLHRRGIKVVLVRYPVMRIHNKQLEVRGARAIAQTEIDDILLDERILLLDFHDIFDESPGLFDDVDHLNIVGRYKFSVILSDALQAKGLLPVEE